MEYAVAVVIVIIAIILLIKKDDKNRDVEIDKIFEGRNKLSPDEFHENIIMIKVFLNTLPSIS